MFGLGPQRLWRLLGLLGSGVDAAREEYDAINTNETTAMVKSGREENNTKRTGTVPDDSTSPKHQQ
jgi:hypothetical protein